MRNLMLMMTVALLAACATGPKVRTDHDPAANFTSYRSYGFAAEPGTDRAGYSTLVTSHFKNAVSREMEARGYVQSTSDPDLLVNFYTTVRERTDVQSTGGLSLGLGYYRYRSGLYSAWPMYSDVSSTTYKVGTASIDIVDAKRKQLVWEGTAEGRLSEKAMQNPGPAIASAVADIFAKYPARAGSAAQ